MPLLRLANTEVKRINLDDEGSYIEVSPDITRRDFTRLIALSPDEAEVSTERGLKMIEELFRIFVRGWSLDVEPSLEAYYDLPNDATSAIDAKLVEHFNSLTVGEPEAKKPKR